eukprot:360516-Chlamydomonas_euryale.AAC.1
MPTLPLQPGSPIGSDCAHLRPSTSPPPTHTHALHRCWRAAAARAPRQQRLMRWATWRQFRLWQCLTVRASLWPSTHVP